MITTSHVLLHSFSVNCILNSAILLLLHREAFNNTSFEKTENNAFWEKKTAWMSQPPPEPLIKVALIINNTVTHWRKKIISCRNNGTHWKSHTHTHTQDGRTSLFSPCPEVWLQNQKMATYLWLSVQPSRHRQLVMHSHVPLSSTYLFIYSSCRAAIQTWSVLKKRVAGKCGELFTSWTWLDCWWLAEMKHRPRESAWRFACASCVCSARLAVCV